MRAIRARGDHEAQTKGAVVSAGTQQFIFISHLLSSERGIEKQRVKLSHANHSNQIIVPLLTHPRFFSAAGSELMFNVTVVKIRIISSVMWHKYAHHIQACPLSNIMPAL